LVTVQWVNFAIGVPVLAAVIAAIVLAIRHRRRRPSA
jgi:uncharacterized protein (TIGR03382 family)